MYENVAIIWVLVPLVGSLAVLVFLLAGDRKTRLEARLDDMVSGGTAEPEIDSVAQLARSALPKMGAPLVPKDEESRTRLQTRLMHAGLYRRQAMVVYLGVKMLLIISPMFLGLAVGVVGLVDVSVALIIGCVIGMVGMIGPSFWL